MAGGAAFLIERFAGGRISGDQRETYDEV